jgi:hypothetical protein
MLLFGITYNHPVHFVSKTLDKLIRVDNAPKI